MKQLKCNYKNKNNFRQVREALFQVHLKVLSNANLKNTF